MEYRMRSEQDCGPAALSAALSLPYELILDRWPGGWRESGFGRLGAPADTPFDHFALLETLGRSWRIVTADQILRGTCAKNQTLILVHAPEHPIMQQHWVLLADVLDGCVYAHWGDGDCRKLNRASFLELYWGGRWGLVRCAYEVNTDLCTTRKLSWWKRLIAKLTGRFI